MIIDAHCHLKHGDQQGTEYTPERIVAVMDVASIERTIVFAISTDARKAHTMTREAIRKFPDRLIGFAYAIPDFRYSILQEIGHVVTDLGFKGIKIHGGQTPLRPQLGFIIDPVLELAGDLKVPCLIDFIGRFEDAQRIAECFPNVSIQVAHLGQYRCSSESLIDRFIGLAEKHENLVLDISGVTLTWKIADAINRVGSHRVVFGIDGPHPYPTQEAYAQSEIKKVSMLGLPDEDLQNVMYGSISRLLEL